MNSNINCNICLGKDSSIIIFSGCKHHICISCLYKIEKNECPYCRKEFNNEILNIKSNKKIPTVNIPYNNYDIDRYQLTREDNELIRIEHSKEYIDSWFVNK